MCKYSKPTRSLALDSCSIFDVGRCVRASSQTPCSSNLRSSPHQGDKAGNSKHVCSFFIPFVAIFPDAPSSALHVKHLHLANSRHPLLLGAYCLTATIHRIVETTHPSLKSAQYETPSERGNVFLTEASIKIIFWGLWRMSYQLET